MSSLASVWSDIKESIFPSEAFADEPKQQGIETQENEEQSQAENTEAKNNDDSESKDDDSESKDEESKDDESNGGGDGDEGSGDDSSDEDSGDSDSEDADGDEDEDEDEDDDEDDEDEEGVVDPLDTLKEKFTNTVCKSFKHHFDECTERVTAAQQEEGYEDREDKEDCVEEFFHLQHCLNDNLAPVLFSKLR